MIRPRNIEPQVGNCAHICRLRRFIACMALLIIVAAAVIMLRSSFSGEDDSPTVTPALEMMATVTATEPTAMVTAMPVITATEMIEETGESIWSSLVDDGDDDVNPDVAARNRRWRC